MSDPNIQQNTSLVDLKFLEGPLTKLAETVQAFTSIRTEPKKLVAMAKAQVEADKIRILGEIEIDEAVKRRLGSRILNTEVRRQNNIDEIVAETQLRLPKHVNEEPVSPDWTAQFFENSQDVSDAIMRQLWAKILAGEIETPGTFSLRTMQLIKGLTRSEAETVEAVAQFSLIPVDGGSAILPNDRKLDLDELGVFTTMVAFMREIGVFIPLDLRHFLIGPPEGKRSYTFRNGPHSITITPKPNETKYLNCHVFSSAGTEILKILDIHGNVNFLEALRDFLIPNAECSIDFTD